MTISLQCISCKHYWGVGKCDAFQEQIPRDILSGEYNHDEPYPGDNGIQFEPIEETDD